MKSSGIFSNCIISLLIRICRNSANGHALTKRRILREALHTHGFPRDHVHNGGIPRLEVLGIILKFLSRAAVNLLLELSKLAGNVCSVAVQHWSITSTDLPWVVQDDHLMQRITSVIVTICNSTMLNSTPSSETVLKLQICSHCSNFHIALKKISNSRN